jgi:Sel1 repeat
MLRFCSIVTFCFCFMIAAATGQTHANQVSPRLQEELLVQRAEKGDPQAQAEILRRAEGGEARAQSAVGDNYEYGFWVPKDHTAALLWYRKAAEQGDPSAREFLGQMYFDGKGVKQDFTEAARWFGCPKPSEAILASCEQIAYDDLPRGARDLLSKAKCEVRSGSSYDYGSAVNLQGSSTPAYQFCCSESPHGPCGAMIIGKFGGEWKELSPKEGLLGFYGACNGLIVLESQHNGFHDICFPNACSVPVSNNRCVSPAIWQFDKGRYRSVAIDTSKTADK